MGILKINVRELYLAKGLEEFKQERYFGKWVVNEFAE